MEKMTETQTAIQEQKDFTSRVNEELKYLGMEIVFLAKCIYISERRLCLGLSNKVKLLPNEIKSIEKVLGMN